MLQWDSIMGVQSESKQEVILTVTKDKFKEQLNKKNSSQIEQKNVQSETINVVHSNSTNKESKNKLNKKRAKKKKTSHAT